MKYAKRITLLIVLLFSNSIFGQGTSIKKVYDTNNKLLAEISCNSKGLWDGPLTVYYPNASIKSIVHYKALSSDLLGIQNSPSLSLEQKMEKSEGSRNGIAVYYYENGKISKMVPYYYGKKSGREIDFSSNGSLYQIAYMYNDAYYGGVKFNSAGEVIERNESKTVTVYSSSGTQYVNSINKQSAYNSIKVLDMWVTEIPDIYKSNIYTNYLYYGKFAEDLLVADDYDISAWADLSYVKKILTQLDATWANINEEQKGYWKELRDKFRSVILTKIAEEYVHQGDLRHLIDNEVASELVMMAEESTDVEEKEKLLIRIQQLIYEIAQFKLDYIQNEDMGIIQEKISKLYDDMAVSPKMTRTALIGYLNESSTTQEATDALAEKALVKIASDMELNNNIMSEDAKELLVENGFFDYLVMREKSTPDDSPLKSDHSYNVIAAGSLLITQGATALEGLGYDEINTIVTGIKSAYDIKAKVAVPGDLKKLKAEMDYKKLLIR